MLSEPFSELQLDAMVVTPVVAVGPPLWVGSDLPTASDARGRILLLATGRAGPGIVSVLFVCAGLVCESAALTAHAMILARESCTPCLAGVAELDRLRTADLVRLLPHRRRVVGLWTRQVY